MGIEIAPRAMAVEARTIRKLRFRILPFVFLLFVVAFLDRINIGFAALTMNKELAISSQQYGLLFGIFFVRYFLFEIPSNLLSGGPATDSYWEVCRFQISGKVGAYSCRTTLRREVCT